MPPQLRWAPEGFEPLEISLKLCGLTMSIDAYRGPDYQGHALHRSMLKADPFEQFALWYAEAEEKCTGHANPITLATVSPEGQPVARTVLLKGFDQKGFCFYTNYNSRKGRQLAENPRASICLFWEELERQIIVIGQVEKMSSEESDTYFATRPKGSRISAHVSEQSQYIENRAVLEKEMLHLNEKFSESDVPRPEHWGGFRLVPVGIEFWQGQPDRLHDRFIYERADSSAQWEIQRLAP